MPDCVSCAIFEKFDTLAQAYGRQAFDLLAPSTHLAFNAFVGVWIAWVLAIDGALLGRLSFSKLFPSVAAFTLCGILLAGVDLYWEWFYQPLYQTMNEIAVTLVSPDSTAGTQASDIAGMLGIVETEVMRAFSVATAVMKDGGITNLYVLVAGVVLAVPYVFVWGIFLAFVIEGVFKLLAVTAVAPLLIAAAAFKPSRGFAIAGFRIVLGGVLTVIFAAVAMGFTLSVMRFFLDQVPVADDGFTSGISKWVMSPGYWGMFLLGFVSVLFHLKAATLAANISGASDGPGAAAAVVGAGMTALAALKGAGLWGARKGASGARTAAAAIGNAGEANHNRLWGKASPAAASAIPRRP
jgi:hypothetical protein